MADVSDASHLADERVEAWFAMQVARKEQQARITAADQSKDLLRPADAPRPLITIARQIGCDGDEVAHAAAARLGPHWHVWDHEIIEAVARSAHVRTKMADALDERVASGVDAFVRDSFGVHRMEAWTFQHHLARVLLHVAHQGYKVIVGRGAYLLLPEALHVRVLAGLDARVQSVMRDQGASRAEARELIRKADTERDAFIDAMARKKRAVFDVTLSMDRLSVDAAAEAVAGAARAMFPGRC